MLVYYVPVHTCIGNVAFIQIIIGVLDLEKALNQIVVMMLSVCPVISSDDGIDLPQKVLFSPERLNLKWTQIHRVGAGLQNMGNTCFLNSALQCLTYTPPFANFMLTREHSKTCKFVLHGASLHQQSSCVIVKSWTVYHINLVHFNSMYELVSRLIHILLINVLSICPCCRSRARVLYDVHHAKPHHSGFRQLWECH